VRNVASAINPSVTCRCVHNSSAGQHDHKRVKGSIRVELRPSHHARGIVCEHPANRCGRLTRRIRTQPKTGWCQSRIHRLRLPAQARSTSPERNLFTADSSDAH
jgi:23S rRNA C2498 (ribose-2'-O)-methylase RlmM